MYRNIKLAGKVALITGAARGLGREYALHLASLGADVGMIDIDLRSYRLFEKEAALMSADTVMDEVRDMGRRSCGVEADLTDFDQTKSAVDKIAKELGDIDILVCNAGGGTGEPYENKASDMDIAQYKTVLARNIDSTVYTVTAVAPMMKKKRAGKIITVCSQAGLGTSMDGGYAHYGLAKAAIMRYTEYLSADLGAYNINVNCIAPGFVATGRCSGTFLTSPKKDLYLEHISLHRFATPKDIAKVVEFLATDLSDYVTGATLDLTGGTAHKIQL
ncbi:MAG: SDR family NAD(P)-dependent oxidoreductase [Christensenellales bacterium]|jgi:3-oxoacyl-[acyl-carrier protein] reductase